VAGLDYGVFEVGGMAQWQERRTLAGELSLSHARPSVDG